MINLCRSIYVFSGLLFLRLFCPAVLSPRLFDLVPGESCINYLGSTESLIHLIVEHPDIGTQRTLTLLAKTLQCLANIVEFGAKETFMIPMNSFIQVSMKCMLYYKWSFDVNVFILHLLGKH